MKCLWCGEPLKFKRSRGWLHLDGQLYKTFVGEGGKTRDDHCAFSIPDDAPTYDDYYKEPDGDELERDTA